MKTLLALCCVLGGFAAFTTSNAKADTIVVERSHRRHHVYHRPYHHNRHHHVTIVHEG